VTPISRPRFSNGKTCRMPGSAESSAVRSAQASITVRARRGSSEAKEASWSEVKLTTSHRPMPSLVVNSGSPSMSPASPTAVTVKDGNRFSKTTTS